MDLTREWLRGVTRAGFVPGPRARAHAALQELLDELIAAEIGRASCRERV